jgi:general secretion pathway protein A
VYANYFGLREPSFSITPDPHYLFLSEQHREALAHLYYGAGEHGGFVLLTGEVGTGKTTVCRAFVERLPPEVDLALILNPAMTAIELLRAVCDEFRIPLTDADRTVKRLVDRLNAYLLEAHAGGRRAVVMIDESQNLKPRVLEQIRLLTNLETAKHKLLQIFLVGQPELRALLQTPSLRQLNQRITARYHLRPFDARDTAEYVRHRLAVAGVDRPLFTRAALRRVHRVSGGIPRLINILCDRALLGACVTRRPIVTRAIVDNAAREVRDDILPGSRGAAVLRAAAAAVVVMGLALGGWWALERAGLVPDGLTGGRVAAWLPAVQPAAEPGRTDAAAADGLQQVPRAALVRAEPAPEPLPPFDAASVMLDEEAAMRLLLRRWGVELGDLKGRDPCDKLVTFGLRCEPDQAGWSRLRDFDRPALLVLVDPDGRTGYAVLGELDTDQATLDRAEGQVRVSLVQLDPLWSGDYLMVWQPPPTGTVVIGPGAPRQAVRWLRKLLSEVPGLGFEDKGPGGYTAAVEDAVRRFQTSAGLDVDGIAGPRTLIRLHNAVDMPGPPRLKARG